MKDDFKLYPERIIKDGGKGMASATNEVYDQSSQHADIFHLYYKCHPHRRFLENAAYRQIKKEEDMIQNISNINQNIGVLLKRLSSKRSIQWFGQFKTVI